MPALHGLRTAWVLWLLGMAASAGLALAQPLQSVPALGGRVMDLAQVLSPSEHAALTQQLAEVEQTLGPQIVLVLVASTQPEDIADYTQRLGDAWKIGRREVGDGLLIVAAIQDRRVRIAPAKSLEGALPDLKAKQIIDRAIVPHFKQGQWAQGLAAAVREVQAALAQEPLPSPQATPKPALASVPQDWLESAMEWVVLLFMVIPVATAVLGRVLGKRLGLLAGAAVGGVLGWAVTGSLVIAVLAAMVAFVMGAFSSLRVYGSGTSPGAWRHGGRDRGVVWPGGDGGQRGWGSGTSWGGGGFSSGGGGDFGGGGASGHW